MIGKHTPGPWRYGGQVGASRAYVFAGMTTQGRPHGVNQVGLATQDSTLAGGDPAANGLLMAAAPTMLETLEEVSVGLQQWLERYGDIGGRLVHLLALTHDAIAKARGA